MKNKKAERLRHEAFEVLHARGLYNLSSFVQVDLHVLKEHTDQTNDGMDDLIKSMEKEYDSLFKELTKCRNKSRRVLEHFKKELS